MSKYRIWICGGLEEPKPDTSDCPNNEGHTPAPNGYSQWHERAKAMGKTHRQTRCPGCQLLKVWVPKASLAGKT